MAKPHIIVTNERYEQFRRDMEAAGRAVTDYHGRYFYHGPAVACDNNELQTVIRETTVEVQWDHLGLGWIVYPK